MFDKKEHLLRHVAQCCGLYGSCETSTIRIAKNSKLPQQTVSRVLHELHKAGLIEKSSSPKGIILHMTKKGIEFLREDYLLLEKLFKSRERLTIEGKVTTGMGEGNYYLSNTLYSARIKKAIGFLPYPGTLNIRVKESVERRLEMTPAVKVEGFMSGKRSFGGAELYPVMIKDGIKGAIIVPERGHYRGTDIVEVIAPVYLRTALKLKDGKMFSVRLEVRE